MAEDLRHLSADQLAERTLGGDRDVAKPLATSDGQVFDLQPVQKARVQKHRKQRKKWQRRVALRQKGPKNRRKAQQKAARYQRYERTCGYRRPTPNRLPAKIRESRSGVSDIPVAQVTKN